MSANPSSTNASKPNPQPSQNKPAPKPPEKPTPGELQEALKTDTGVPDEVIASATSGT